MQKFPDFMTFQIACIYTPTVLSSDSVWVSVCLLPTFLEIGCETEILMEEKERQITRTNPKLITEKSW